MSGKRVLIVDDEPMVLSMAQAVLNRAGHKVETASAGNDALQKVRCDHFDLLITDLHMPGMAGDELATQVKRIRPTTKIVLMTALPPLEQPPDIDWVLTKPFSADELRQAAAHPLP